MALANSKINKVIINTYGMAFLLKVIARCRYIRCYSPKNSVRYRFHILSDIIISVTNRLSNWDKIMSKRN
jgi:hypothetical protein